jgi:hemolysin activation/secretion protein
MLIGAIGSSVAALAQTAAPPPSQVAPPVIVSPPTPPRISVSGAPAVSTVPEAAKTLSFVLTGVDVEGEFTELAAARQSLAAPLVGKRITVAQAFDLADKLQQAYINAGFLLARVVVVPQQLEQAARFKLQVIDGFVERIDATALAPQVRERVGAVLLPLLNSRHLTQGQIERRLLIAGDTPGLALNATLATGKEVGGSILIVTGKYRPISASLYVDDNMPRIFGGWQTVAALSANSLLGAGEQISMQVAGLPNPDFTTNFPTRRYLSATAIVPLGIDSLRLEGYFTNGVTTPRVNPNLVFPSQGLLNQGHAKLSYDAYKGRDFVLTTAGRLAATDEQVDLLQTAFFPRTPLHIDRVRPLRGSVDGIWRLREAGTTFAFSGEFSRGLDAFGARNAPAPTSDEPPLSRAGAGPVFNKFIGHLEVTKTLPVDFVGTFDAFGQTAFNKPLLVSEQYDIAGVKMLSGFVPGILFGDNAWSVRGEIGRPFMIAGLAAGLQLTPYAFGARGGIQLVNPSAVEFGSIHASNVGGGVRANLPALTEWAPAGYAFFEFSRRWATAPNLDGWRIFAGLLVSY